MVFKNLCILVLWAKVASAFEGGCMDGLNLFRGFVISLFSSVSKTKVLVTTTTCYQRVMYEIFESDFNLKFWFTYSYLK